MKNIFTLIFLTLGSVLFAQENNNEYSINGHIKGLKSANGYMYLTGSIDGKYIKDSVIIEDGRFIFKGNITEPAMVKIYCPRINHPHKINPFNLFLENSDIIIKGKYDTTEYTYLKDIKISGSVIQDEFESYSDGFKKIFKGVNLDKMNSEYRKAMQSNDTAKIAAINKISRANFNKGNEYTYDYIKENPKSCVSLYLIGRNSRSTEEKILNRAKSAFLSLDPSLQFSVSGKRISKNLAYASRGLLIGKPAGDFTQPDVNGNMVRLSDYKGKYVLLDFWASWCGPCRAENPHVLKAYNRFKDKGFDVLAVSLDNNPDRWKKAIKEDKLPWVQVSDLKQSKNEAASQFGVSGIPDNFLIDPNGIVIARGLRGDALEKKLEELIKEDEYVVSGVAPEDANGEYIYMLRNGNYRYKERNTCTDSTLIENGEFKFEGKIVGDSIRFLSWHNNSVEIILEKGKIFVDICDETTLTGTPQNIALCRYKKDMKKLNMMEKIYSIKQDTTLDSRTKEQKMNEVKLNYDKKIDSYHIRALNENNSNALGEYMFRYWILRRFNVALFDKAAKILNRKISYGPLLGLKMQVEELRETSPGAMFKDFTIKGGNINETDVSLSDYVGKGKYVLVDFWASWCGWCRAEFPVISEIYNKYKGDKFEVVGLAVNDKKELTLKAMKHDGVTWPQILNCRDIPMKLYGVSGIPEIILFAPDGTIIARGLRGEALKLKVAELLEK